MRRSVLTPVAIAAALSACVSTNHYRLNTATGQRVPVHSCAGLAPQPGDRCVSETHDSSNALLAIPIVLFVAFAGLNIAASGSGGP